MGRICWAALAWSWSAMAGPVEPVEPVEPPTERPSARLEVATERFQRVREGGFRIDVDDMTLEARSGWIVPLVAEPGGQTVGFVWLGEGELTLELPDRADALRLANRLALDLGVPREQARRIATEERLATPADVALVVSSPREVARWLPAEQPIVDDPHEIVVYADRDGRKAARQAQRVFARRTALYRELGLDVTGEVLREAGLRAASEGWTTALVDVRTAQRFGVASTHVGPLASEDGWVALVRDATGASDPRRRSRLVSMGRNEGGIAKAGRIGGTPFDPIDPEDPTSVPAPPVRLQPERATSRVRAELTRGGGEVEVEIASELVLRAVGGPVARGTLELPDTGSVQGAWRLAHVAIVDRAPLDLQVDGRRVDFTLSPPLPAGETLTVEVTTADTWRLGKQRVCPWIRRLEPTAPAATASLLPRVGPWATGDTWRATVEVITRPEDDLVVLLGGDAAQAPAPDGRLVTRLEPSLPARDPSVTIGRWSMRASDPAPPGLPAVAAYGQRVHPGEYEQLAPEARRVTSWYGRWLPPAHGGHLAVTELAPLCMEPKFPWKLGDPWPQIYLAPLGCGQRLHLPAPGTIPLRWSKGNDPHDEDGSPETLAFVVIDEVPLLESGMFAHNVAHQHWGQLARPAFAEDHWIVESLAEVYACTYVAAAFRPKACEARMERARVRFEGPEAGGESALSGAYEHENWDERVWLYGPYVLYEMLRPRVGDGPFFAALDLLLIDHPGEPLTTERLQRYFELASGQDLADFFDFWVHQGRIPKLALEWAVDGQDRVRGTVLADVPFGRLDVPVRIRTTAGDAWIRVDVVDGEGVFEAEIAGHRPRVALDPEHRILARSRSVRRAPRPAP